MTRYMYWIEKPSGEDGHYNIILGGFEASSMKQAVKKVEKLVLAIRKATQITTWRMYKLEEARSK